MYLGNMVTVRETNDNPGAVRDMIQAFDFSAPVSPDTERMITGLQEFSWEDDSED